MTKLIRNRSVLGDQDIKERFLRWWRQLFKTAHQPGNPINNRTDRPFMFWDLSDG